VTVIIPEIDVSVMSCGWNEVMCGVEGESGLSVPEGAEAYNDSSAVVKDVVDITELARDSGRIRGGGGTTLKDAGGGGDGDDVVGAASTAASCGTGSDAGEGDGEGSASTTGLGIAMLGASFTGDAKGSSECVSAFLDVSALSPGRP